jgi:hypothetical protein
MIEINLLPDQMRKKKKSYPKLNLEMDKLKFIIGGAAAGLLILSVVLPSAASHIRKKQVLNLILTEQKIMAQKTDVEGINKDVSFMKGRLAVLNEITKRDFLWAEKMNGLSESVLPGIWFTRIYTDSENRLILEGSVISKNEEAMALVGKFMKDIRENEPFFRDFKDIKLESVQRKNVKDRDVVDFKIVLYFKKV